MSFTAQNPVHAVELEWINSQLSKWQVPGVVVVISRRGQASIILATGLCQLESATPCSSASAFPIGSTTKFLTSIVTLEVAADNQFNLNRKIATVWPEFRLSDQRWQSVSLIDLLSQRSGIGSVDWPYYWDTEQTTSQLLSRLPSVPMQTGFRESWAYSNTNFVIAAEVVKKISGKSWEQQMQSRIFNKLEIKDFQHVNSRDETNGYWIHPKGHFEVLPFVQAKAQAAAGSLVLDGNSFAKVLTMLVHKGVWQQKQIVPERTVDRIGKIHAPLSYDRRFFKGPSGYGLGLFVANYKDEKILYHSGGQLGFTTHLAWLPDAGVAVAVMANINSSSFPHALALGVLDDELGQDPEPNMALWLQSIHAEKTSPKGSNNPSPSRPLKQFTGTYENPAWGVFEIIERNNHLRIRFGDLDKELVHWNYDSFRFESAPGWEHLKLRFDANFEGKIDSFWLDDTVNKDPFRFNKLESKGEM